MVSLESIVKILNNTTQINTRAITITAQELYFCVALVPLSFCVFIAIQCACLYTVSPLPQICNYCFMQIPFKSDKRKMEIQNKYTNIVFYIYLWTYFYQSSWFLQVDSNYCLVSTSFQSKGLPLVFVGEQVCWWLNLSGFVYLEIS